MAEQQQEFVLACIDQSSIAEAVVDYASWLSKKTGAPLRLQHNVEHPITPDSANFSGALGLGEQTQLLQDLADVEAKRNKLQVEQGKTMLAAAKERAEHAGANAVVSKQRHGDLTEAVIALEERMRVLVMGIRGEQHENDGKIGAHLEAVGRSLHKPILVVNQTFAEPKKFLLYADDSDACKRALEFVTKSPLYTGMQCVLAYEENCQCSEDSKAAMENAGIPVVSFKLDSSNVIANITELMESEQLDLMVMGAFRHNKIHDIFFGSFTAKVLKATNKPVLLLR